MSDASMSWGAKIGIGVATTVIAAIVIWVGVSINNSANATNDLRVAMARSEERQINQSKTLERLEQQQSGQYTAAQARSDQLLIQADIAALRGRVEALEKRSPH